MNAALGVAWHFAYVVAAALTLVLAYGACRRLGLEAAASWCKDLFRALSHTAAAVCTGSAQHSFSAQCGARAASAWRWRAAERCVDAVLGEGHCRRAAEGEGLI